MGNVIKEKFNRYGISEWVTLVMGIAIAFYQGYKYHTNTLGDSAVELVVLVVWLLLIIAPLTLANIIRKARGIDTK